MLVSFAAGVLVLLIWSRFPVAATVHQIFPAVLASLGAYIVLSWRRPVVPSAVLDRLFR